MPKHVHYNESVCSLIVCENWSTERNPTFLKPPEHQMNTKHNTPSQTPNNPFAFSCSDCFGIAVNRSDVRTSQKRWVSLHLNIYQTTSTHKSLAINCVCFAIPALPNLQKQILRATRRLGRASVGWVVLVVFVGWCKAGMPKHVHYNESVCSLIVCENCSTERNPTFLKPPEHQMNTKRNTPPQTPNNPVPFSRSDRSRVDIHRSAERRRLSRSLFAPLIAPYSFA